MHQPYPEFSDAMHCAKELVAAWKAGTLFTDRAATAKHCYTLVGYGLGVTFGEPDKPLIGSIVPVVGELTEAELFAELESFASVPPGVVEAKAIPWPLILMALELLLRRLLKE